MSTFRAIWPVVDPARPIEKLLEEAAGQVRTLAAQAHARITGPGRWALAPSAKVPGSGRVTDTVLVFEAPAVPAPRTWR